MYIYVYIHTYISDTVQTVYELGSRRSSEMLAPSTLKQAAVGSPKY